MPDWRVGTDAVDPQEVVRQELAAADARAAEVVLAAEGGARLGAEILRRLRGRLRFGKRAGGKRAAALVAVAAEAGGTVLYVIPAPDGDQQG